jgi:hypothetical protein
MTTTIQSVQAMIEENRLKDYLNAIRDTSNQNGVHLISISPIELYRRIQGTKGRFFGIEYLKKDGTYRQMTCRTGVTKRLKGGEKTYSDIDRDMITLWLPDSARKDAKKNDTGYRTLFLNKILSITIDGIKYIVDK